MKTSHDFLRELCALPPDFNAQTPQVDPRNRRVRYLLQVLTELGVEHYLDVFAANGSMDNKAHTLRYANVVACVPGRLPSSKSLVFLAHHDVANVRSENANDNTASLANLLALLGRLQEQAPPNQTVWVVFTDAEEICSFHRSGAWRLAQQVQTGALGDVSALLNLELTAYGTALFCDHFLPGLEEAAGVPVIVVSTPFSDATTLRRWHVANCATIGTLPPDELQLLLERPAAGCRTWARCHRMTDRLKHAKTQDMATFVDVLWRIVTSFERGDYA